MKQRKMIGEDHAALRVTSTFISYEGGLHWELLPRAHLR